MKTLRFYFKVSEIFSLLLKCIWIEKYSPKYFDNFTPLADWNEISHL